MEGGIIDMEQGPTQVEVLYKNFRSILQDKDDSLKDVLTQFSMIRDIDLLERKIFKELLSKQAPPRYHVPIESTDSKRDKEIQHAQKDISESIEQVHAV